MLLFIILFHSLLVSFYLRTSGCWQIQQGASSKCFSSSKISRINLVDLAGLDRNKVDDAGRQFVKESKSVKKSLSQLGYDVFSS